MKTLRLTWEVYDDEAAAQVGEVAHLYVLGDGVESTRWHWSATALGTSRDGNTRKIGVELTMLAAQLAAESAALRLLCEGIAAFKVEPPPGCHVEACNTHHRGMVTPGIQVGRGLESIGVEHADATALGCALLAAACGKAGGVMAKLPSRRAAIRIALDFLRDRGLDGIEEYDLGVSLPAAPCRDRRGLQLGVVTMMSDRRFFRSTDAAGRLWHVVETDAFMAQNVMEFFGRDVGDETPIVELTEAEAHGVYLSGYESDEEGAIPDGCLSTFPIGQAFWSDP